MTYNVLNGTLSLYTATTTVVYCRVKLALSTFVCCAV